MLHGGVMFDFKGFTLGLGYAVRPNTTVMRDDFAFGKPAPFGAEAIAYVERSTTSVSVVLGFDIPRM